MNAARRTARTTPTAPLGELEGPTDPSAAVEDDGLRSLIASLPERQRLVLFLRYYADLDYRAIADVLALEVGTVGATLNQAHRNLRRLLTEVNDR